MIEEGMVGGFASGKYDARGAIGGMIAGAAGGWAEVNANNNADANERRGDGSGYDGSMNETFGGAFGGIVGGGLSRPSGVGNAIGSNRLSSIGMGFFAGATGGFINDTVQALLKEKNKSMGCDCEG